MRSIWNGSISFGLVNIPVKMFAATESKAVRFKNLHRECLAPIRYEKVCPYCNTKVKTENIIRGYEYEKGRYVTIEDAEMETLPSAAIKAIDILDFVSLSDIDPVYFNKTYYLSPSETGLKAYRLLHAALDQSTRIGIAKVTLRNKQHLAAVRTYANILVIETMHYPDEVRSVDTLPNLNKEIDLNEKELTMALQLIDSLTEKFNPAKYHDEYRNDLLALIEAKISGTAFTPPTPREEGRVVDLLQALRASIDAVEKEKATSRQTGTD